MSGVSAEASREPSVILHLSYLEYICSLCHRCHLVYAVVFVLLHVNLHQLVLRSSKMLIFSIFSVQVFIVSDESRYLDLYSQ